MSTSLKWSLGILAAFLLICCGGGVFLINSAKNAVDNIAGDALKVGDATLAAVGSNWNIAELKKASTDTFSIDPVKLTEWKSQLGAYKSGKSRMSGISAKTNTGEKNRVEVKYTSDANFEKGTAVVTMSLVKLGDDAWKVDSFNVEPAGSSSSEQSSL